MKVLETDRLVLRRLSTDDGAFILELLNDPSWLRFIGDRGVRTIEDARNYILRGPMDMYARLGFGLYMTELKQGGAPIGICGLVKRDGLDDVDLGFAFLPRFREQGYAREAAAAVMEHAKKTLGLERIVAITTPENHRSVKLLETLGLRFERTVKLPGNSQALQLFATTDEGYPMESTALQRGEGKTVALGGHTVRFLQRASGSGYALVEWMAPPAIPGPPLHVHRLTDEGFYVLEGAFGFQVGDRTLQGSSGAYVFGPRGLPHTYWNQGPAAARLLILISPPGFEPYFEELSEGLAAAGNSSDAAIRVRKALSGKYDIEVVGSPRQAHTL